MKERPTPETDANCIEQEATGNMMVTPDFARKLERQRDSYAAKLVASEACEAGLLAERDEVLELLASEKSTRNTIIAQGVELERQLDEAITTIEDAKRALKANDYEGILLAAMRVKEERDESLVALREAWLAIDELVDVPDRIINWQNKYAHTLEETK